MSESGPYETEVVDMKIDIEVGKARYQDTYYMAKEIAETANRYHRDGYDLISITPVINGEWDWVRDEPEVKYGFSFTESVVMLFKDRNHQPD